MRATPDCHDNGQQDGGPGRPENDMKKDHKFTSLHKFKPGEP